MLRASAAAEAAGVPSSTLVCEGFLGLAASTSVGLGLPNIPVAPVPGHTGVQSKEELRRNILGVTLDHVAMMMNSIGLQTQASGTARISNCALTNNTTAIDTSKGGGPVTSFRNNLFAGNATDNAPSLGTSLK